MKRNYLKNTRSMSIFWVGCIVVSGMLASFSASAARCNLGFTITQSVSQVDLTGVNVGDTIAKIENKNINGTGCDYRLSPITGDWTQPGYMDDAYITVDMGPMQDPLDIVEGYSNGNHPLFGWLIASQGGVVPAKNVTPNEWKDQLIGIRLKKKLPGKTVVNLNDVFVLTNWNSSTSKYTDGTQSENFNIINNLSTLTLIYRPTCSATVNDIDFQNVTPSGISAGTVTSRTMNINVSCDAVLPSYTVKISSPNGTLNAGDGEIESDNSTIGYRLSWGNDEVAAANTPVQLDTELTPMTKPTQTSFTLPVRVLPIQAAGTNLAQIQSGPANSAIRVDLIFN